MLLHFATAPFELSKSLLEDKAVKKEFSSYSIKKKHKISRNIALLPIFIHFGNLL